VLLLEAFVHGLAVIFARQPDRDPAPLREIIDTFVSRLLAP
jgi:hypothetical protein